MIHMLCCEEYNMVKNNHILKKYYFLIWNYYGKSYRFLVVEEHICNLLKKILKLEKLILNLLLCNELLFFGIKNKHS